MRIFLIWTITVAWSFSGSSSIQQKPREPPVFIEEPVSTLALKDKPVSLKCNVGGNPRPVVQWQRNGKPVPTPGDDRSIVLPLGELYITKVINKKGYKPDVGVYQCKATNAVGIIISRKVNLSVAVLSKKFSEHPQDAAAVEGTTARFSCKTKNAVPDPVVTWEKDGHPVNTTGNRFFVLPQGVLQISDVRKSDEGQYRCVAKNIAKTRRSNSARLTVNTVPQGKVVLPNFTVPPANTTSLKGQTVVMECVTTGKPLPVVKWKKVGSTQKVLDVSAGTTSGINNLKITPVTDKDSGKYECTATTGGKTIIRSAWLSVKEAPQFTSQPQKEVSMREGRIVNLLCTAKGSPHPRITWLKDGRILNNNGRVKLTQSARLTIQSLSISDGGVYQCFAENDVGNIQVTSTIKVRRSIFPRPGPPTNLKITALSSTELKLTWSRPVYSFTIISYSIHCSNSRDVKERQEVSDDSTLFTVDKLQPNTMYACSVLAYSTKNIGIRSQKVMAKTLETVPKGPPGNVRVTSDTPDSLDVSWTPVPKSQQNGLITKYTIRYGQAGLHFDMVVVPGTKLNFTISQLLKGKTYTVQIAAKNAIGSGPFSKKIDGTVLTTPNNVISAPLLTRTGLNSSAVKLSWMPPKYGESRIAEYRLYHTKMGSSAEQGPIKLNKQKRDYILNQLDAHTEYIIELRAWDGKQAGKSATLVVTTLTMPVSVPSQSQPPAPPRNIRCTSASATSLNVYWDAPSYVNIITSYTVRYKIRDDKNEAATKTKNTQSQNIQLTALAPGAEYTITIQSHSNTKTAVPSQFSNAADNCITPEARPSSPPLNVKFQYISATSVDVMWEAPNEPNGELTMYKILYSLNNTLDDKSWPTKGSPVMGVAPFRKVDKIKLSDLKPNATYYVKIFAANNEGYGPPSEPITIDMDITELGKPIHNISLVIDGKSAVISWTEPIDSKSKILKYILVYALDQNTPDDQWQSRTVNMDVGFFNRKTKQLRIQLLNLKLGTTYYYRMRVQYSAGFGPWSKIRQLVIPADDLMNNSTSAPDHVKKPGEKTTNEDFAVTLGIIIGCAISAFCIVVLVLFIIWRNPCRHKDSSPQKQTVQFINGKGPGNGLVPPASQQIVFHSGMVSQGGQEESSLSSNRVCNCHCHSVLHRPPPRTMKPTHHHTGNGQAPTVNGNGFLMNGSVPLGSISSDSINTNGSVGSHLGQGVISAFPAQHDGKQYPVRTVVLERRTNSNSISVDV